MRALTRFLPVISLLITSLYLAACSQEVSRPPAADPDPSTLTPSPTVTITATPFLAASPTSTTTPAPIPKATATRAPSQAPKTCLTEGGRIETHTLSTELSQWPWEFRVYLPPCYDQEPERRYPVLTLIHGSTFNDDQWDRLGADEVSDDLIAEGEIEPLIIVMPRDRRWVEPNEDPFGEAVVDHILPWVDATYRTLTAREFRAIGGLSRGAAWAVHLGLSRWEEFGAIGGHSLPVFWTDTPKVRDWLGDIPMEQQPRFYLDIGENDYLIESATWFEGVLDELNIPHEWYLFPGRHEESYWESHMDGYLRWYTLPWTPPRQN